MTFQNQISIGPEFFVKAKNDYSDYHWALVREFMQNSMDCKSTRITISLALTPEKNTLLSIHNDGTPMTKEILVGKLLALGGSGKGFQGTVGGFGKAKELLYFMHLSYRIESGPFVVVGRGAGYDLTEGESELAGTRSEIVVEGERVTELMREFKRFCAFAQWDGVVELNGEVLECNLRKGSPRRELGLGKVYSNRAFENKLIVRVNGVPMFHRWTGFAGAVVVELNGTSGDCLTSNRDGLRYEKQGELDLLLEELAINKRSALKAVAPSYQHFKGEKLSHVRSGVDVRELVAAPVKPKRAEFSGDHNLVAAAVGRGCVGEHAVPVVVSQLEADFIVKNETELKVPACYLPEGLFGAYARKLARVWGRLLLELHELFEFEDKFSIGFVFSESAEAQFERGQYGRVYYLNPVEVVQQKASQSKSFAKRFQLTEKDRLLSLAVHEFVHGLGHAHHDEDYATALTEAFAKVLKNRSRFMGAFRD